MQQARNLAWKLQDGALKAKFLLRDRDTKFTAGSDEVFKSEGVEAIRLPYRAPQANSYSERWVGSARWEVLDRVLIFGCRHLEEVLTEFIDPTTLGRTSGSGSADPASRPKCSRCLPGGSSAAIASAGSSTSTAGRPDEVTGAGVNHTGSCASERVQTSTRLAMKQNELVGEAEKHAGG